MCLCVWLMPPVCVCESACLLDGCVSVCMWLMPVCVSVGCVARFAKLRHLEESLLSTAFQCPTGSGDTFNHARSSYIRSNGPGRRVCTLRTLSNCVCCRIDLMCSLSSILQNTLSVRAS